MSVETSSRANKAHSGVMRAHLELWARPRNCGWMLPIGVIEAHPGAVFEVWRQTLKVWTHPGVMKAQTGVMEINLELKRLILKAWRLPLEPLRLTLES
jgi:hypothetical protein